MTVSGSPGPLVVSEPLDISHVTGARVNTEEYCTTVRSHQRGHNSEVISERDDREMTVLAAMETSYPTLNIQVNLTTLNSKAKVPNIVSLI